jgi:hypothetical protein
LGNASHPLYLRRRAGCQLLSRFEVKFIFAILVASASGLGRMLHMKTMAEQSNQKRVGPHDYLHAGTKVRVRYDLGTVIESLDCRDQHGGQIFAFKIRFTARRVNTFGSRFVVKPIAPFERIVNYSFVDVVQ